ncbi:T9SS type A sorting domain-containing protein [Reichenbachiella carrageenanivorans]|uniref:T9SS type A sorting domain-containing protein n=1 Tax=Reichenbachiella carrageenanivorans TaxID=2979869 RepID=A0ABY6D244_9BACT|nr:T9SS type A sorting domain-containing protein [Reichenbachiella carrageenanivorans]UXX80231.1 T9SS type A sorting domain-containing protein [Reichenbachiella carrageenanivorans]
MKNILTIVFLLSLTCTGFGQYSLIKDKWDASYSIQGGLDVANVAFSSTGEVYVFGTNFTGGDHNAILVKYDANGNYQWDASYSSSYGNSEDFAVKVALDEDDNIFTVTNINPDDDQNTSVANGFIIHKYNDAGTLLSEYENVNDYTVKYGPKAYDFNLQHIIGNEPNYLYLATTRLESGGMGLAARLWRFDNSLNVDASSSYDSELDDIPLSLSGVSIYFKNNSTIRYATWNHYFESGEDPESTPSGYDVGSSIDKLIKFDRWYLLKLANGQYHIRRNSTNSVTYDISYTFTDIYDTGSEMLLTGSKTVSGHEEMVLLVLNRDTGALIEEKVLDADHGTASSVGVSVFIGFGNKITVLGNVVEDGVQYPGLVTFDEDTYEQIEISKYTSSASSPITHAYEGINQANILIGSSGSSTKIYALCMASFAITLGSDKTATIGETVVLKEGVTNRPNVTYLWSTGATTQTISVTEGGTYSLTVYSEYGCPVSDEINVTFVAAPPGGPKLLEPVISSVDPISPVIQFSWKNDDPDAVDHVLAYDPNWNPNPGTYIIAYNGPNTSYDFEISALADSEYDLAFWSENSDNVGSSLQKMTLNACSDYDMSTLGTYLSESSLNGPSEVTDEGGTFTYYLGGSHGPDLAGSFFDWDLPEGWELDSYNETQITVAVPADANSGQVGVRIVNPCSGEATSYLTREVYIIKDQTIDFPEPDARQVGAAPFDLGATASSGLAVTYDASPTDILEISNGIATALKAGTVTVTASQAGNSEWNAAPQVQQTLTVSKGDDVITFNELDNVVWNADNFDLDDLASSKSGRQITWAGTDDQIAMILSLGSVDPKKPGAITITASLAGNDDWNAAPSVQQTLTVEKANQTITFLPFPGTTTDDEELYFSEYISITSGLVTTKHSSNTSVATVDGGALTIQGAGTTIITASQAGNEFYNAAENQQQTLTVTQVSNIAFTEGSPTISHYHSGIYRLALETTDDGYVYYIVEPSGGTAPTAAQIQSGRNADGDVVFRSDADEIFAGSETTLDIYGLEESTAYDVYLVLESADNELQPSVTKLSLTTETLSSLAWSAGYPQFEYFCCDTYRLLLQLTENGNVYYVVEPEGSDEPTAEQIQNGNNASGSSAFKSGSAYSLVAGEEYSQAQISGLSESTAYDIYLVVADEEYNVSPNVTKMEVMTGDYSAPEWSEGYPQMGTISSLEANVAIDLEEETGMVYYAVFRSSSTTHFPANLKNGSNYQALDEGSVSASAPNFTLSNLSEGTDYDVWLVAEDASENLQSTATKIDFTTIDDIHPVFDEGYPELSSINETAIEIQARLDEQVTIYAVAQISGNPTPTAAQVVAGEDYQGQPAAGAVNSEGDALGTHVFVEITELTSQVAYDIFVVAKDPHSNTTDPVKLTATTSDQTAPIVTPTYLTQIEVTETTATFSFSLNEAGTFYYVLDPNDGSTPSPTQVMNGQIGSGESAPSSENIVVLADQTYEFELTGLTAASEYEVYFVAKDENDNVSEYTYSSYFETSDSTPPVFTSTPEITAVSKMEISLTANINEYGSVHAAIITEEAPIPSVADLANQNIDGAIYQGSSSPEYISIFATLELGITYQLVLVAEDESGNLQETVTVLDFTVPDDRIDQVITFELASEATVGDPNLPLNASNNSGMDIYFKSSDEDIAIIVTTQEGMQIQIIGGGTVEITAYNEGDLTHKPGEASKLLTVAKLEQTINFTTIGDKALEDSPIALQASASSNLTVEFVLLEGNGVISGNELTINETGLFKVEAIQTGNNQYDAALSVIQIFEVAAPPVTAVAHELLNHVRIYPVPFTSSFSIALPDQIEGQYKLTINSLNGTRVYQAELNSNELRHEVTELSQIPSGIYLVQLSQNNQVKTYKLIKSNE